MEEGADIMTHGPHGPYGPYETQHCPPTGTRQILETGRLFRYTLT